MPVVKQLSGITVLTLEHAIAALFCTRQLADQGARVIKVERRAPVGPTAEQLVACLDAAQIANARVNAMADVWAHPQLQARGRWIEVDTPSGLVPALLPPGRDDPCEVRMDAVPALGAHTLALLPELGHEAARIENLQASGAV
ncbi:MAG: CoA transferase [Rhizobacter sp.]